MLPTIKHQDTGQTVVVAKLLTGYLKISSKVDNPDSYIKENETYDANFTAYVVSWKGNHGLVADGIIDEDTWRAISKNAPTCSTSKNRVSGYTMALQILLGGNITCDAIYGTRTKAAVATYQDAKGLASDGICGPKTWNALIVGADVKPEPVKFIQPKDFKQGAKPWGPKMYSNHNDPKQTMANSGCGPTSMADIVATLKDKEATPWTLARFAMQWGDRTYDNGTAWTFFKPHTAEYYQFVKVVQSATWDVLRACIDAGGYVVCSMGPGYWTNGGHFICAWKYDDTYVYCNDPASSDRKKQKISQFMKERKQFFCFYPNLPEPEKPDEGPDDKPDVTPDVPDTKPIKRGSKICDVSKYQPTIDYDAFIADTALIILRAGYRGTKGGISEDQKFELHAGELRKRGVRFGVYFYSIATDEEKAREEARMFHKYAKDYDPLFWAMDAEKDSITKSAIVAFADELRNLGAKKVGCYVANHMYQKYDYGSIKNKFDFTWIPRYSSTPPVYTCGLWQYTSTGAVGGISGNVDLSRITGQEHDLAWFTDDSDAPTPTPEPEPTPEPSTDKVVRVTGGSVNVRSGPGTSFHILGVVRAGDKLPYADEQSDGWYRVKYGDGPAWMSGKYSVLE